MSITVDGNSFTWDGTVTLTNATDLSSGVAQIILTPSGGIGTLPVLAKGDPGPPPVIDSVTVTQIDAAISPAAPTLTKTSPGGAGVPSHYAIAFEVNKGAKGDTGAASIGGASDLEGSQTDQYTVKYVAADSKFKYAAQLCGDTFSATSFASYTGNATLYSLASVTVPAQPFNWRPQVTGTAIPVGTSNTQVDLVCRINNPTSGDQVGYGKGVQGSGSAGIPAFPVTLQRAFGAAITGSYGVVAAGSAATLFFLAIQVATTTDSWGCSGGDCYFSVKVDPIPGTN